MPYTSNPAFEKWLDVYIEKKWVVTAFKFVAQSSSNSELSSSLIRLSFKTDRPFFPYRESQGSASDQYGRSLGVYLFSHSRMEAVKGHFGKLEKWPGKVQWAGNINQQNKNPQKVLSKIAKDLALPQSLLKKRPWLTVFKDNSSPRPGTADVYFAPGENKTKLPHPIIKYKPTNIPVEPFAILIIGAALLIVVLVRRNNDKQS